MNEWLSWLFGFDRTRIPEGAETDFIFTSAPQSWGVFVLIGVVAAVIYLVWYLYRRESDTASRRAKFFLGAIRVAVVVLLAIVFIGPALAISQRRSIQPYVVVMIDDSQSMSIRDRYLDEAAAAPVAAALGQEVETLRSEQPDRLTVVRRLLEQQDSRLMRDLAKRGKIRIFTYSTRVRPLETRAAQTEQEDDASPAGDDTAEQLAGPTDDPATGEGESAEAPQDFRLPAIEASGQGTILAGAIREALKSLSGNRIAAIVLIGDGQNTAGSDDPLEAAQLAAAQKVPILTVGVGDTSKPQNLKVGELLADDQVWQGDPFELRATIESEGLEETTLDVELVEQAVDGSQAADTETTDQPGNVLERRSITLPAGSSQQSLTFKYTPKRAGQFAYTLRLPVLPTEFTDRDNAKSAAIKVVSEKARVLLICGSPSWEYRFVQTLLTRDKTIDLSVWLQSMDSEMPQEGDTPIEQLPREPEQLFKYDLVMMFDPDPSEFNDAWFQALKRFLGEHGGGLLYMAGPKFSSRFLADPRAAALRDVLPVRLGDVGAMEIETLTAKNAREWPLAPIESNMDHPVLRFDTDAQRTQALWQRIPGIYWSFPVAAAKPATRTLLEHTDPSLRRSEGTRPLMVSGQYGSGRTLFMGFNGTWRWRRLGRSSEYFSKFWIQSTRYLVEGRLLEGKRRGTIDTGGDVFRIGDTVTVTAQLYDPLYQPLEQPQVQATLAAQGKPNQSIALRAVADQPGVYEGSVPAMNLNLNELSIDLPGENGAEPVRIARQFSVVLPRVEFEDPRLNRALLVDIAARSGGQYFDVNQLDGLAEAVPVATETIVVPEKPAELWDTNRLLILLVGLLTVEWAVRKRTKLL